MGHVVQSVKITADKTATVSMLVDTGATFSLIPRELARALGIKRLKQSVTIRLGDGRPMKAGPTTAIFKIGERETLSTILVGDVVEPILGVETLEALGLAVDPRSGRLRPTRGYAARLWGSPVLSWSVIPRGARRRNQRATSPQTT